MPSGSVCYQQTASAPGRVTLAQVPYIGTHVACNIVQAAWGRRRGMSMFEV